MALLALALNGAGGWITRGRCENLGESLPILKQFCKGLDDAPEPLGMAIIIVGVVFGLVLGLVAVNAGLSLVHIVSTLAEALAPYFGWIGVVILVSFGARAVSDAYYKIATKLENLENK
jgi:membrane-bound ClpP family serine protease